MSSIGDLATSIYQTEFYSNNEDNSLTIISGWLQNHLGELNNLLYTNFSGSDPDLGNEEKAIFSELYMYHYYNRQARAALRGVITESSNILSLQEGDSQITFTNKNEVAKSYRGLANDSMEKVKSLAQKYNSYEAAPQSVRVDQLGSMVNFTG
jgi:hypothetical protein